MSTALGFRKPGMHGGFGRIDRQPIHHFDRRRHDAAADDRRHRFAGLVDRVEARQQRQHGFGAAQQAERRLRDDRQRPFGADEHRQQVEPGRIQRRPAEVHQLAVGQHRFDAEHVVDGETVLQAVRAAGVLGDVPADRADDLARRIGRVVAARSGATRRVISRFVTPGSTVTRRFGMSISRIRFSRDRPISTPSGCGSAPPDNPGAVAARHERHAVAVTEPDDRLHFGGVGRKHDRAGTARRCTSASDS